MPSLYWRAVQLSKTDLLRKSGPDEDAVAEGGEIDPKVKPVPSVAIGFLENAEDLEPPNDVLYGQPHLRQSTIVSPLILGERVKLTDLLRLR